MFVWQKVTKPDKQRKKNVKQTVTISQYQTLASAQNCIIFFQLVLIYVTSSYCFCGFCLNCLWSMVFFSFKKVIKMGHYSPVIAYANR